MLSNPYSTGDKMFSVINHNNKPIKIWDGNGTIPMEDDAIAQLKRIADMPFVPMVSAMPDLHLGKGAAVGSVIPTIGAVIPAAVGVDLGCGMLAARTSLTANDLPESLKEVRSLIEKHVPHGRTNNGQRGDRGAWSNPPRDVENKWSGLLYKSEEILPINWDNVKGKNLYQIYREINQNNFYFYKNINGKSYKTRPKK